MDIDIHIFLKVPRFRHRSYSIIRVQMWQFGTEHKDHLNTWLNLFNDTMHDLAWQEAPLSKTKVPPGQIHLSLEILTIINWEWKLISRWWIVGETKLCIPSIRADKWFWCIVLCCTHDMKCMDGGPPAGQHDKIIFCLIIQSWHVSVQWWGAPLKFLFLFLFQSLTLTHECFFHDSFYHHMQGLLMKGNYSHLETSWTTVRYSILTESELLAYTDYRINFHITKGLNVTVTDNLCPKSWSYPALNWCPWQ